MTACEWVFMRIKNLRIKTRSLPTTPWPGCAQPIGSKISTEQVGLHFEREHSPNRLLKARVDNVPISLPSKIYALPVQR